MRVIALNRPGTPYRILEARLVRRLRAASFHLRSLAVAPWSAKLSAAFTHPRRPIRLPGSPENRLGLGDSTLELGVPFGHYRSRRLFRRDPGMTLREHGEPEAKLDEQRGETS